MTKTEKVLEGLKYHFDEGFGCEGCPYRLTDEEYKADPTQPCHWQELYKDSVALIHEQQEKAPAKEDV